MSVQVSTIVWKYSQSSEGARLVLLYIADCCNHDGGGAYPSIANIANACRLSERAVQYNIRRLEQLGELEVSFEHHRHQTATYAINVDRLRGADIAPLSQKEEVQFGAPRGETSFTSEKSRGAICDNLEVQLEKSRGEASCTLSVIDPSKDPPPPAPPKGGEFTPIVPKPKNPKSDPAFEAFWISYPKGRSSKAETLKVWKTLTAAQRKLAAENVPRFKLGHDWRAGYHRAAERYLKSGQYEDPPPPEKRESVPGVYWNLEDEEAFLRSDPLYRGMLNE